MTKLSASELPAIPWQDATIVDVIPRTPRVKSFILELQRPLPHRAGQHVDVRLTAPDGRRAMRSYSIASAPGDSSRIELAIELLENGEVSPFFHNVAVVGDVIEVRGPLGGHFAWSAGDGGPLMLVGGGSGVVPLMSMIRHRHSAAARVRVPTVLLFSARCWDDLLYREELFDLACQGNGFEVVLTLTREASTRAQGYHRRVDPPMIAAVLSRLAHKPRFAFICGSNGFVSAAADGMLDAGLPPSVIRTERYGP
jgi:ferredoxin-NADP reductase